MSNTHVVIVVVVYNNKTEVMDFINRQLLLQTFNSYTLYIVVNSGDFDMAYNEHIKIVRPGKNTGYVGALRWVMENEKPSFDYIILCNTDIHLNGNTFLNVYITALEKEKFAVAGPMIISALTGAQQNPLYNTRIKRTKIKMLKLVYTYYLLYILYQTLFYIKNKITFTAHIHTTHPYALHGSFITLSSFYFEKGGTLAYPVFLYGEEIFFAEEAQRISIPTLLINDITIVHNEHSTTGIFKSKQQVRYLKQSVEYIYNTYYANGRK